MVSRPKNLRRAIALLQRACAMSLGFAALSVVLPHEASAGTGVLRGRIVGAAGRHPWVVVVGERYGAAVDSNGVFEIAKLPAGTHRLMFSGFYCDPLERKVTTKGGSVDSLVVELRCTKVPCTNPDKADPECIESNPYEASRVGKLCEVHSRKLRRDLVPIEYGIVGCSAGAVDPSRYPNAKLCVSGGCVVGQQRWGEVAYCDECRAAYYAANPPRLFAPPRPANR